MLLEYYILTAILQVFANHCSKYLFDPHLRSGIHIHAEDQIPPDQKLKGFVSSIILAVSVN
jgi:hypothetical protein